MGVLDPTGIGGSMAQGANNALAGAGASAIPWAQMGMGVLGGAMNMFNQNHAFQQQQQLMQQQFANQQALNVQGQQLAQQNWDYTNAENQVNHYKKAGLNVGLMYGGGGTGGQLASGSGGSASGSNAPQMPDMAGLAMQMASQQSQIKLNEALANKANAEATKTSGVDTANVGANTALTEMNTKNAEIANNIATMSQDDVIETLGANRNEAIGKAKSAMTKGNADEATYKSQVAKINSEAINEAFKLTLMKSDANLNNEKARAVTQELAQEWERLYIETERVGTAKMQNAINEFTAKVNAKLGQGNLQMRQIEAGIDGVGKILGSNKKMINIHNPKTTNNNY